MVSPALAAGSTRAHESRFGVAQHMVPNRRLILAANDQNLASIVQAHLQKAILLSPPLVSFEDVPQLLTPDTDGELLLLVAEPRDYDHAEVVVRETKVQHLPPVLSLIETDAVISASRSEQISQYLSNQFRWPSQSRELTIWARNAISPGIPFADPQHDSRSATIRRKLINQTPSLTSLVDQLCIAAEHDVPVLIEGETGTGKTVLAKLIHDCSTRRGKRLVAVACGSHTGSAIGVELFGRAQGAFGGAEGEKAGKLLTVGEGTIILDEIELLPLEHQASLLRVIETGEFEPAGSDVTQFSKARIIASSNSNLAEAVERGTFRRDLYYRLHVVSFHLPPLRQRPEDITPLVLGMVARYGTKYGKRVYSVCSDTLRLLEALPWPGNIRQLEHTIQQALLTTTNGELKMQHISRQTASPAEASAGFTLPATFEGTLKQTREATERANILRALEKANQSRTRAAQILGVSRVTLYKKMKHYQLLKAKDGPISIPFDEYHARMSNG